MKRLSIYLLLASYISLNACVSIDTSNQDISSTEMSLWSEFSIIAPMPLLEKIERSDGSIAWINYDKKTAHRLPADISIEIYQISSACITSITGISENINRPDDSTVWGRVNAWDNKGIEGWDPADYQNVICTKEGTPPPQEIYTLCSEKNGRTVVVCINEFSNNPSLAKQIFETFRWTD